MIRRSFVGLVVVIYLEPAAPLLFNFSHSLCRVGKFHPMPIRMTT